MKIENLIEAKKSSFHLGTQIDEREPSLEKVNGFLYVEAAECDHSPFHNIHPQNFMKILTIFKDSYENYPIFSLPSRCLQDVYPTKFCMYFL